MVCDKFRELRARLAGGRLLCKQQDLGLTPRFQTIKAQCSDILYLSSGEVETGTFLGFLGQGSLASLASCRSKETFSQIQNKSAVPKKLHQSLPGPHRHRCPQAHLYAHTDIKRC